MRAACRARPHPPPSLIAVSRGRSRAGLMPLAKVPPTLPPKPPRASLPEGAEGSSKFLGVPPERRLATSKVPWWRSRRHGRGRKASSQHFLLWLIRRGGWTENKRKKTSCPTFPVSAPPLAHFGPRGVLRVAGAGPPGNVCSAAAHLPPSVPGARRAPRPPSSGRPFLAPAAAALAA